MLYDADSGLADGMSVAGGRLEVYRYEIDVVVHSRITFSRCKDSGSLNHSVIMYDRKPHFLCFFPFLHSMLLPRLPTVTSICPILLRTDIKAPIWDGSTFRASMCILGSILISIQRL